MQRYRVFSPGAQVLGRVMQAAIKCQNSDHIEPYLRQNGLLGRQDDLQPIMADRWYSQQDWLNVLNALMEESRTTAMFDLVSVGMTMAEMLTDRADFGDLSLEEKLRVWCQLYQEQHRGDDIGEISIYKVEDRCITIDARIPYPDEIQYGVFHAIASHHFLKTARTIVRYDERVTRRDAGGDITRYHVTWEPVYG